MNEIMWVRLEELEREESGGVKKFLKKFGKKNRGYGGVLYE
jgi:hypothetical protein